MPRRHRHHKMTFHRRHRRCERGECDPFRTLTRPSRKSKHNEHASNSYLTSASADSYRRPCCAGPYSIHHFLLDSVAYLLQLHRKNQHQSIQTKLKHILPYLPWTPPFSSLRILKHDTKQVMYGTDLGKQREYHDLDMLIREGSL